MHIYYLTNNTANLLVKSQNLAWFGSHSATCTCTSEAHTERTTSSKNMQVKHSNVCSKDGRIKAEAVYSNLWQQDRILTSFQVLIPIHAGFACLERVWLGWCSGTSTLALWVEDKCTSHPSDKRTCSLIEFLLLEEGSMGSKIQS